MIKNYSKEIVRGILSKPHKFEWSLQGLGMLRLYLTDQIRLHVWSTRHAVESVSELHTHPWDFTSTIIAGCIVNTRYSRQIAPACAVEKYWEQRLFCGPGGNLIGKPAIVELVERRQETYLEGDSYSQLSDEIHKSSPIDGSVSIIERRATSHPDHASVFWKQSDGEFVSAEARRATKKEINQITRNALNKWFL